jgi:hypothetical protein
MFGAPPGAKAIEGKNVRDEEKEAFNALIANVVTFGFLVGVIRMGNFSTKKTNSFY